MSHPHLSVVGYFGHGDWDDVNTVAVAYPIV